MPMGGTDCALPMVYATEQGLGVDTFVVYTDNETWASKIHAHQALAEYRRRSGIAAKLVVVGRDRPPRDHLRRSEATACSAGWDFRRQASPFMICRVSAQISADCLSPAPVTPARGPQRRTA